ncbi:DrmB family protein [Sorangium sp. So ce136]|uniref:DrmB family protein n=1 Tax=Sorangium sp. So ce136 TaxID=3133284 RepID=UPI003F07EC3A
MNDPKKRKDVRRILRPDGQLRQSQLVSTFGPGAMVDLVDRAVVIGGLEHWSYGPKGYVALDDPRLRRSLIPRLKALDPDLDLAREGYFRMAPEGDARNPFPSVGVRALEFPRWFVCQKCRRLARASEQFENKSGRYRHECAKNKWSSAVPVRFVAACKRGHLSDFPWISFAHLEREGVCDRPELYLHESLGDIARIIVQCKNCNAATSMNKAMVLPYTCNGDRPWLGGRAATEPCDQRSELLVRTASHAYFGQVVSALRLPDPEPDPLRLRLREKDVWKAVQKITTAEQLSMIAGLMEHVASALRGAPAEKVLAAIRAENEATTTTSERPLRSAEYDRLVNAPTEQPGAVPDRGVQFAAYRVPKSRIDLPSGIGGLVVVPELREVRVQVSFSRFDSIGANLQGEYEFAGRKVKPTVLTLPTGNEKWLPAAEVRGEGVFVELDEKALSEDWEKRDAVKERAKQLERAFGRDRKGEFPGIRFFLLHSLSHLLLTAVSLECGYAASAIRERIYCGQAEVNGPNMAAVMLTTGTTGSEGTLGGLVEEGRRIRHHLREAWDLGRLCSNDPVCAAHDPSSESSDRRTEGAACHGCLYIAECSCEWFNRFLDRALVVPTIGNDPELAFFKERP